MPGYRLKVRPADCDSYGHVNNAAYVSFLEAAVAAWLAQVDFGQDWQPESPYIWRPSSMSLEYTEPARYGEEVEVGLQLVDATPERLAFASEMTRANTGKRLLRGGASWTRYWRQTGELARLEPSQVAALDSGREVETLTPPRAKRLAEASEDVHRFAWEHRVTHRECGLAGWLHPAALFPWFEDAVMVASASVGWTPTRAVANNFVVLQRRHDVELFAWPRYADRVRIISRLVQVGRLRGTWLQQVYSLPEATLLASEWSTGVFLTVAGEPRQALPEMLRALQYPDIQS